MRWSIEIDGDGLWVWRDEEMISNLPIPIDRGLLKIWYRYFVRR